MSHLAIALTLIVPIAIAVCLASYVSMRRTYRIDDLPPLSNGREQR